MADVQLICKRCNNKFLARTRNAKWCNDCKDIVHYEQQRKADIKIEYE